MDDATAISRNATQHTSLSRRGLSIVLILGGALLLSSGAYFAFLFRRENWTGPITAPAILIPSHIAIGLGIAIIVAALLWPRRNRRFRMLLATIGVGAVVVILLIEVVLFGFWLGNDDAVNSLINRSFAGISEVKSGSILDQTHLYFLRTSPAGSDLLRVSSLVASSGVHLSILDKAGRLKQKIPRPPGISFRGTPSWSPDGQTLIGVGKRSNNETVAWAYSLETGSTAVSAPLHIIGKPYGGGWSPDSKYIVFRYFESGSSDKHALILDARTLTESTSVPANIRSLWVRFIDSNHLLFISESERPLSGPVAPPYLASIDLTTMKQSRIPVGLKNAIPAVVPPCFVRGGKWILTSFETGEVGKPYLVNLNNGDVEPLSGLDSSATVIASGGLWDGAESDGKGNRAVISSGTISKNWPHASGGQLFLWENGHRRLKRLLPGLPHKFAADITASGEKVLFYWASHYWYKTLD